MRIFRNLLITIHLIFFLMITTPSTAEIKHAKIESDTRHKILLDKFGFTNSGHVSVAISSVSITSVPVTSNISQPDPSRFGFFLLSEEAETQVHLESKQNRNLCVLDSKFISLLFTFQNLSLPLASSFNKSYNVTYPDYYLLSFANCNPLSHVTMDVRTELYNTNGNTKEYVSVGLKQLLSLYSLFSWIYILFLVFWIVLCSWNPRYFYTVHLLMGGLLFMRATNLIWAAEDQYHLTVTGTPHGWDHLFCKFQFIKAVVLFAISCSGWFLPRKEDGVLITSHGKNDRNSTELSLWKLLFIVVFAYLLIGRLIVLGAVAGTVFNIYNMAGYKDQWVFNATDEILSFFFYIVVFCILSPALHKDEEMSVRGHHPTHPLDDLHEAIFGPGVDHDRAFETFLQHPFGRPVNRSRKS